MFFLLNDNLFLCCQKIIMENYIQSAGKLKNIQEQISQRLEQWRQLKPILKETLEKLGETADLDFSVSVTDHIENWESISFKLKDVNFSYYIKGNKKQAILKQGASLVYGLMPSGYIKVGMVFPKINDIKEKEIPFVTFEIIQDLSGLTENRLKEHMNRFLKEIADWELEGGGDIRVRIGFKGNK